MRKCVNQGLAIHQQFIAKHQKRNVPKAPPSASVRSLSSREPAMKKPFSPSTNCPDQLERSQEDPISLMQHNKGSTQLGQQINQILLHSSDVSTILHQIAQVLGEAFQVNCCTITTIAEQWDGSQIGYWHSESGVTVPPQPQHWLENLAVATETLAHPLTVNDINTVEPMAVQGWQHLLPSVQAVLQIPICFQGKVNGLITLLRSQPYNWTEIEPAKVTAITEPVAIAIAQILQTQLINSLQQQTHTANNYKNFLKQLMLASRSSLELNQILQLAIAGTAQTLQVERGLLLTLKYADPLFKTRSREKIPKAKVAVTCEWFREQEPSLATTITGGHISDQSFWISDCRLCQQAFTGSPNPVIVSHKNDLLEISPTAEIAPLFNFALLPSLLMLPLESQGTVLGFLVLQHSNEHHWQPEELALVELVSAQVSTAIIQNQTLRQVQLLVEERTAQLRRSLEVQGKLYEKTRQQVDQLRQLNQLKDDFLSTMSHELRTPLTSMNLAIRMLRQPGLPVERQTKYLDILDQQCSQEIKLINDLLQLQQLESNQATLKLETIDLKPKIYELAQSFEQKWADKGLTITVDIPKPSLLVQTDAESFERILQELLMNAGKYSNPDTNVSLCVTHEVNSQVNQTILSLTNVGAGISSEDIKYIFDKFRRGQGVTQNAIQGTGLGLALVKCLVQQLNGTIDVTSTAIADTSAYETCFTLTLPQFFASR